MLRVPTRIRHDDRVDDASVAVEQSTHHRQEVLVGNLQRPEREALPRCEAAIGQPAVELDVDRRATRSPYSIDATVRVLVWL